MKALGTITAADITTAMKAMQESGYQVHQHIVAPPREGPGWTWEIAAEETDRIIRCLCGWAAYVRAVKR